MLSYILYASAAFSFLAAAFEKADTVRRVSFAAVGIVFAVVGFLVRDAF